MSQRSNPKPLPIGISKLSEVFCGCCTTENVWNPILQELSRLDKGDFINEDGLPAAIVDHMKLSEHGTSIRGGWLTEEGKEALAFLEKHGVYWEDDGPWLTHDGCTIMPPL